MQFERVERFLDVVIWVKTEFQCLLETYSFTLKKQRKMLSRFASQWTKSVNMIIFSSKKLRSVETSASSTPVSLSFVQGKRRGAERRDEKIFDCPQDCSVVFR